MKEEILPNPTSIPKLKYVGGYRLGNQNTHYVQFNLLSKPCWFHRQFMKILLGWYWYDA
jgi:hypothetical protein